MLKVLVRYPSKQEEFNILERFVSKPPYVVQPVMSLDQIKYMRGLVNTVYIDEKLKHYILDIVFATRYPEEAGLKDLAGLIEYGSSPRASINLTTTARAMAFLKRRGFVIPEDIKELAPDVLRHRIILTYEAEAEEITTDEIIKKILEGIEVP